MNSESHPYQVSIWITGNGNSESIFEKGHWIEQARSMTKVTAGEVATCLSLRWPKGVRLAEAVEGKFVPYKHIPESASELK